MNIKRGAEDTGTGPGAAPVDDPRVREAERLLAERGVTGARVSVAGHERDIAAVVAPPETFGARLVELAPAIRALGFRSSPWNRVRLFFAINLPAEADRLHRATARLRADLPVRWVPPQNLHVTLRFLGSVAGQIVACRKRVRVPPRGSPRSTHASAGSARSPTHAGPASSGSACRRRSRCLELHAALEQALAPLGFAPEDRAFQPHITLGRVRDGARPAD